MPRLLSENSFSYFKNSSSSPSLPVLPENWVECFLEIWAKECELAETNKLELFGHLNRHFGPSSTYAQQTELTSSMQNIYLHISNQMPRVFSKTEIQQLLEIIKTDISECTPGFHNRVNETEKLLNLPFSMDEIRQVDRNHFIDEFARKISSDVHDHNKIFFVASKRFGVIAPNEKDPYINLNRNLTASQILDVLELNIQSYYQPLQLIVRLTQKIESILEEHFHYVGFIETGYDTLIYQNIFNYLQTLFVNHDLKMDEIFITNDDFLILDVNFYQIQFFVFQYLKRTNIIETKESEELTLVPHLKGHDYDYRFSSDLFCNHFELIAFLDLYRGKNLEFYYQTLKQYLEQIPGDMINSVVFDFMISSSSTSKLIISFLPKLNAELKFINSSVELNEEHKSVLLISASHQLNIEATLKFCSLFPEDELKRLLWVTTSESDEHVLFVACKKNAFTAKQFIEGILKLTDLDTIYKLFRHTNFQNESILSLSLLNRNGSHKSIFQVMRLLSPLQNESLIRYKDNFGYNLLMQAIRGKQEIFHEFIDFVQTYTPSVMTDLLSSTSLNGLNSLTFTILYHPYAFNKIIELIEKQDLNTIEKILSQNNQNGDNCFFVSAIEKISCFSPLISLLQKLPHDVQADILKKKSKKHFTLLDVITDARETEIEQFLQFISSKHPGLLYYFLSHNVNPVGTPLATLLEDNSTYVEALFKYIHQLTPEAQFKILTTVNPEELSPLILAFKNSPNYAFLIYSELMRHYQVKKDILIDYIFQQSLHLNHKPRDYALFLECLLLTPEVIKTEIIAKFLNKTLKTFNVIYTKTLIEGFVTLIHKQFNTSLLHDFLEILMNTASGSGEDNIEILLSVILEKFDKTPSLINIKYVPYLIFLMKITRFHNANSVDMIIDFVERQAANWQKIFFTAYADEFKNNILSVLVSDNFDHFHCLFNCIRKLGVNEQISIFTQVNHRGKNFLHVAYERLADNPLLEMRFISMFNLLDKLDNKILKKILYTPTQNLLALAIEAHPQTINCFLRLFDKFSKPQNLKRLLLTHQDSKGWSPLFLALKVNKTHQVFSQLMNAVGQLELADQIHIFNQSCFEKVTLLLEVKEIKRDFLSLLLSYATVDEFNQSIEIINKMPVANQKELVSQCEIGNKYMTVNPLVMKLFEEYKDQLSSFGKRVLNDEQSELNTRKLSKN